MNIGIFYAILGMFGFGLASSFVKYTSKLPIAVNLFWRELYVSLFIIILLFFKHDNIFISYKYIFFVFVIAFVGYASLISFYKAIGFGKTGVVVPIANSSIIYTVILSIVFYNENLSKFQFIALIFIILGIILVSLDLKDIKNSKVFDINSGIPNAIFTSIAWGIMFFLLKIPINILGPILTSLFLESFQCFLAFIKIRKLKNIIPKWNMMKYIILVGITATIGAFGLNNGIKSGNITIIAPIVFSNPLITIIYGKIFFKEKLSIIQYISSASIILGIILISYF